MILDQRLLDPIAFFTLVVKGFNANQGLLLSGALAYYTLLSIIPLIILVFLAVSYFVEPQQLVNYIVQNLENILPNQAQNIANHILAFVSQVSIGWIMLIVLLFFSSMTFTVIENAMSIIFKHRVKNQQRHFLVSVIIPYLYIFALSLGFLVITIINGTVQAWQGETITILDWQWQLGGLGGGLLYFLSILVMVFVLASVYIVMPVGKMKVKHAFIGAICATFLWEIARHILIWYFSTLSMVNMIYGSLATAIIFLIFLEVGAIILLMGAQFIAEYERIGFAE